LPEFHRKLLEHAGIHRELEKQSSFWNSSVLERGGFQQWACWNRQAGIPTVPPAAVECAGICWNSITCWNPSHMPEFHCAGLCWIPSMEVLEHAGTAVRWNSQAGIQHDQFSDVWPDSFFDVICTGEL